jgi:hypothetical protein
MRHAVAQLPPGYAASEEAYAEMREEAPSGVAARRLQKSYSARLYEKYAMQIGRFILLAQNR